MVLLLVIGALGASAAFTGAANTYTESHAYEIGTNITYDTPEPVPASQEPVVDWLDNETVTNETGTSLSEGTDYDWNTLTGKLTVYDTAVTSSGEKVTIEYAYDGSSSRSAAANQVLGLTYRIMAILTIVGAGLVVINWTSWIGGGGR